MSATEHFDKMEAATAAMRNESLIVQSEGALSESTGPAKVVDAVPTGSPALSGAEIARRFMRARYGAVPADDGRDRYMTRLGLVYDALHFAENEAQVNTKL